MPVTIALSDCHKVVVNVLKKSFQKAKPMEVIGAIRILMKGILQNKSMRDHLSKLELIKSDIK